MFERLGSLTFRLRYLVIAAWAAGAIASVLFAPSLAAEASPNQAAFLPKDSPSVVAKAATERAFPASTSITSATITFARAGGLTDADRAYLDRFDTWVRTGDRPEALTAAVSGTASATSRPELAAMLRSDDKELELLLVNLDVAMAGGEGQKIVSALRDHLAADRAAGVLPADLQVHVTGTAGVSADYLSAIERGTDSTTVVTVVLVVLILLLIYRAPLAALVPLVTIGAAFVVARGLLGTLAAMGWEISSLLDTFLVVLVFGVGTDYAIFLISRYREEVSGGGDWHDASRTTVRRIGAVISASAATVIVGLGAMAFGDFKMITTTGPALAVGIFVTLVAGLTLTPALLGIFGHYLFWPRHLHPRPEGEPGGFFARLANAVSRRPGLVTASLLVALLVPAMAMPQMKTNFDILSELPTDSDARLGYEAVADHLGEGKLVQATGLIDAGPRGDMRTPASLARVRDLLAEVASTPGVGTVTSLVTPNGNGVVPDAFRPSSQLRTIADELSGDSSGASAGSTGSSSADLLKPEVDDGLATAARYVASLEAAYPDVAVRPELKQAVAAVQDARDLVARVRKQAVLSAQLRSLADAVTSPTSVAGGGGTAAGVLGDYLDELAVAYPEVRTMAAYRDARSAAASLERAASVDAALRLATGLRSLAAGFDDRPDATFSPTALSDTDQARELRREATAIFDALPIAFRELATVFAGRNDDIFVPLGLGGDEGRKVADAVAAFISADGRSMRFYLTTTEDPYSTQAFATIRALQPLLASAAPGFGAGATAELGGPTAEFRDIQDTLGADFQRVGVVTIIGILIVLMVLLRSIVAPLYLVATVLLSYATALGLSAVLFQDVLGQPGVSFYLPLIVFVLLVALGSDYNIFLMSRVREESEHRPIRDGIRIASGYTGAVITSAGLILAGTFGSMATAPLLVLFQVGVAVAIGVLIDTFLVRSILVPAITTLFGERAWWPTGLDLRRSIGLAPVPVAAAAVGGTAATDAPAEGPEPTPPATPRSWRRLGIAIALVVLVPAVLAGLLTWSLHDPGASLGSLPVAVVDEDAGSVATAADGTATPLHLGADLAASLARGTTSASFAWTATDAAGASAGLGDGRYAAVLTIPSDFSARVAAIRADRTGRAPRATLRLVTNDATSGGIGAVARDVTAAIAATTAQTVTDAYVRDILLSVSASKTTASGDATRAKDLADRATGLATTASGIDAVAGELVGGLDQLANGVTSASSGSSTLATGTRSLADGTGRLASGVTGLSGAATSAASGAGRLARGAGSLSGGLADLDAQARDLPAQADALTSGAQGVANGATGVASGATDLSTGLTTMAAATAGLGTQTAALDQGARALATGAAKLADGASASATGAATLKTGAADLQAAVTAYTDGVAGLSATCVPLGGSPAICAQLAALAAGKGGLDGGAAGVAAGAADLADGTAAVATGAADSASGAAGVAAGTAALAAQAPGLETGIATSASGAAGLASGAREVASGANALAAGMVQLDAGMPALAGGISQLSSGAASVASGSRDLAAGLDRLAAGTDVLATGARQTAAGADALASGTAQAASGAGQLARAVDQAREAARLARSNASQLARTGESLATDAGSLATDLAASTASIPGTSDATRSGIAQLAAAPVAVETTGSAAGAPVGGGLPPIFLAVALWVGALAIFLVLPGRWWRRGGGWRTALAIVGGWALLGLVQGVLAVLLVRFGLGVEVARLPALVGFGVLAAVTFAAIVQAFVALWGRRGWLVALLLLGLQLAATGIPYAVDAVPAPLSVLQPFLPLTWAIDAMRASVAGAGASLPVAAAVLVAWLVVAVLVTLAVAADRRARGQAEPTAA